MATNNLDYESYNIFLKSFEYNYPYKHEIIGFPYQWRDNLSYLKKEILNNLISLTVTEKEAYLKRLSFELKEIREKSWSTSDMIDDWLKKYEVPEYDIFNHTSFIDSEIHRILSSEPVTFKDTFTENLNPDKEKIQFDFYNYYYGLFLDEALIFIDEQNGNLPNTSSPQKTTKLKTKLSVPQLTYFFKALVAEGFFEFKTKTEIYDFISANFSSKGSENISFNTIKNNYEKPKLEDVDFLHTKFINLYQTAKKDKENL